MRGAMKGRLESAPITEEHVAAARRLFQAQREWPSYQDLCQRCRVPRGRWWRFIEVLNQRGIASFRAPATVVAVSGRAGGQTFEQFLAGRSASDELWATWQAGELATLPPGPAREHFS